MDAQASTLMAVARMGERWFWLLGLNPSVPSARFRWMASMGMRRIGFSILTCAVQPMYHIRRTPFLADPQLDQLHHRLQRSSQITNRHFRV